MNCPNCSYPATAGQILCQNCGQPLAPTPVPVPVPTPVPPGGYQAPGGFGAAYGYGVPPQYSVPAPPPSPVGTLARANAILFGIIALTSLVMALVRLTGNSVGPTLVLFSALVNLLLAPFFLVWFFKIRKNASLWQAQPLSQGWSIAGWLVPPVLLWFPYWITKSAWRTSMPAERAGTAIINAWWICWVLAWFTSLRSARTTGINADGTEVHSVSWSLALGNTTLSNIFTAAAAVLCAVIVMRLSQAQDARPGSALS